MAVESWRLKLEHGEDQIVLLGVLFAGYLAESSARIEVEERSEPDTHLAFVFRADNPPPPMWGPMIGDCIHNLRSALDHLCFALPRDQATKARDEDIYFPCSSTWRPSAKALRGLQPAAVEAIKRVQTIDMTDPEQLRVVGPGPGQPGFGTRLDRNHPLDVLKRLSNTDKHRNLVVGASGYGHIGWQGGSPVEPMRSRPLADGDVLMDFAPGEIPRITGVSLDIMFEDGYPGYGAWVTRELQRVATFIRQRVFWELEGLVT